MDARGYSRLFVLIGRLCLSVAFLSLLGAWITQLTGGTLVGMNQQHLYNDSMALALIGVGALLDGFLHSKGM